MGIDMNTNESAILCSKCGERKLHLLSEHEWVVPSPLQIAYHRHWKCVNCGFEQNECWEKERELLASLFVKGSLAKSIEAVQCEKIERDPAFQIGRIYHYFTTQRWAMASNSIEAFRTNEKNRRCWVENEFFLTCLSATCLWFVGMARESENELAGFTPVIGDNQRDIGFIYDILVAVTAKAKPSKGDCNKLKQKWFADFALPFASMSEGEIQAMALRLAVVKSGEALNEVLEEIPRIVFRSDKVLQIAILPLFIELVRQRIDWQQWPNDEIVFLEQIQKTIIPTEANPRADIGWFREIKRQTNQLAFDLLLDQRKFSDAFKYIETTGVDYIRTVKGAKAFEYGDSDYLLLPTECYPVQLKCDDWLGEDDVHQAAWQNADLYSETWARTLAYLTIVDFYREQLARQQPKDLSEAIKDQILLQTDAYKSDAVGQDILNWKFPQIVADIYLDRKNWQKGIEFLRLTNEPEETRTRLLEKYNIDGELFKDLAGLSREEQRQLLAFSRLFLRLEPQMRDFIRRRLRPLDTYWLSSLHDMFPELAKRKEMFPEERLNLASHARKDDLDWLTLGELLYFVTSKSFWQYFDKALGPRREWEAFQTYALQIRNNLAHSIPLTELEIQYAITMSDKILQSIGRKEAT